MANPEITIRPIHAKKGVPEAIAVSKYNLIDFQDTFDTKYNSVSAFGRTDPIYNYQGTTRKIVVGIRVTDVGVAQPIIDAGKKMQYPVYDRNPANALNITRPPLVLFKMGKQVTAPNSADGHLLCVLNGFSYTPKSGFSPLDSPVVDVLSGFDNAGNALKLNFTEYTFRFDFVALHPQTLGFLEDASGTPSWIGGDFF